LSTSSSLPQPQQSHEEIEIFNVFESCENYDCEDVIRRGEVLNAPLQNDIVSHGLNIPLNIEERQGTEEYIEVRQSTAEFSKVMNSTEQNSLEQSRTVEFGQVVLSTEENGEEPQRADDFNWEEFLEDLL
jgi:hypothetical protein